MGTLDNDWRQNLRQARSRKKDTKAQSGVSDILLSVMIPTIPGREPYLNPLVAKLNEQIKACGRTVELLCLLDNRCMTIGEKRNHLAAMAHGRFHIWTDDDNEIEGDYIAELVESIESHPDVDVITFDITRDRPNGSSIRRQCRLGEPRVSRHAMMPHHIHAWRAELARQVKFPDRNMRDDWPWTVEMNRLAETEHHIDKVLYHYRIGYGGGWDI